MIEKTSALFSSLRGSLPLRLEIKEIYNNYYLLIDNDKLLYHLYVLDYKEYNIYLELKKSKYIKSSISEIKYNDVYLILFKLKLIKDKAYFINNRINILINIFKEYSHTTKLSKRNSGLLKNQTTILNNKFSYYEMRIREIETKRIKNDNDWVILSKYHIFLDARLYLYDLLDDIFKYIDSERDISIGLIFKNPFLLYFENEKIEPSIYLYYGPYGMLLARIYIEFSVIDDKILIEEIKKLNRIDKVYFLYSTLYILILSFNFDIEEEIDLYLDITKKLYQVIYNFGYITKESFK